MNLLLLLFALVHLGLLIWTFSWEGKVSLRLWFLRLMLLGMCFDNSIQGLGIWFGPSAGLEALNHGRYCMHAATLPWLALFGLSIMREAGIGVASKQWLAVLLGIFVAAALSWGLYHDAFNLQLQAFESYDVFKYVSTSKLPPIGTILANLFLMIMGVAVWRVAGWAWLFLGSLFIFALNGATGAQPWGFFVGNFAEVVFIISLLATERRFR